MTENPELQPPPLKDASPVVTQASTSSSTSAVSHASLNSTVSPSTPGFGLPALWAPSFPLPAGPSGSIATVAPPGLVPSVPMAAPSTVTNAPSSMLHRPGAPLTPVPLNPAVLQHQIYPSYPSLPAMGASPHGFWQQPPPMGGVSRPPFVPYAAPYPGSFSFPARGMAPPSVLTTDSQPPGVSQPGTTVASGNSVTPSSQPLSATGVQTELPPQGIDNRKLNGADTNSEAAVSEQTDLWTAHRTDTGIIYYYNALTGESTYEKPAGFKMEPDKVPVQPTPVSMEQLPGTDWALVTTSDGKKYYYNSKTKISSWQIPSEVTELRKKQESELSKELPVPDIDEVAGKGPTPMNISAPAVNTGGREAVSLRNSAVPCASSALDLIKKKLQDSGVPATSSPPPVSPITAALEFNGSRAVDAKGLQVENSKDKTKDTVGDGNMSDSSSDSEDDNGPSKEECIVQFKEMLKERGIAPFSKWEKELPKIVFDPRFKAIPSHSARRSLFEHYVKTRAEEERKEKRAAQKAAIEGFRHLLNEASEDIDHNMDYQTFRSKWGSDPRFEALDRKDREALLNERVLPLKKAAAEKARAVHEAAASSFKGMLQEKGDININSRWSRVKDSLRDDPRYTSVKHEEREVLFNEYISELKATQAEAEREVKTRKEEEDKLKERERELRKRKEREEQEMERVKVKVRRKEAVASFQALLVETIKDPQASWTESKPKLEKDPQQRANNPDLEPSEMEKLFREHTKMLLERCTQGFKVLLAEVITSEVASQEMEGGKTVLNSWSTAKRLLKPDPRYIKMPRKDREDLWHRHADRLLRKQKSGTDQKEDKLGEVKGRRSGETERHAPNSRRTHDRG